MNLDIIEELKKEHLDIERELIELEEIIKSDIINYSNLVHTMKKIYLVWDMHEKKEEILFLFLEEWSNGLTIPVERMMFEHKELKPHKEAINNAINSGNDEEVKKALEENGRFIIIKLQEHIDFEDEILYRVELPELSDEDLNNL